ncbi:hypothetical protein E4T66_17545 [Sinimarinibacterium sp. CAU 1509]|nr:hypothetical protein E4T66_17545 [Sinimarinibacterium sp. CAU 1509]
MRALSVVVLFLLAACAPTQAPESERARTQQVTPGNVRIGAFNMQNFGPTKSGNPTTVNYFAKVVLEYDALVLQEIEDASGDAPAVLLHEVNRISSHRYELSLSPRLGRTSAKEQYALIYRPDRLSLLAGQLIADPEDEFERDPFAFTIQHDGMSYGLIALHAKPDDAVREIDQVAFAYDAFRNATGIDSVMIVGDLNADCSYASDAELQATALCSDTRFSWLIPDGADTTTGTTDCAYDRLVVRGPMAMRLLAPAVYRFDQHLGISGGSLSDHYPVEVELGSSGGDYSGFTCAPQAGMAESPYEQRSLGRNSFASTSGSGGSSSGGSGGTACCRTCSTGKACGDSCISRDSTCHVAPGCACNAGG